MAQTPSVALSLRILGALAGLVAGAVLGIIVLGGILLFVPSYFGLNNVLIGGVIGGCIGLIIGFCYPGWAGRLLNRILEGV